MSLGCADDCTILRDVITCILAEIWRLSGDSFCLHHQVRRVFGPVGRGTALRAGGVAGLIPDAVIGSLNLLEPQETIKACVEVVFKTASQTTNAEETGRMWYIVPGPGYPQGGEGDRGSVTSDMFLSSFRPHYGPGVDSASNRNEYQEYFLGGKDGRCVGLTTLPPSCANCLEIWESQSSGTLWACRPVMGLLYLYR